MKILKKLSILILLGLFFINIFSLNFAFGAKLSDDVSGFEAKIDSNVARSTKSLKIIANRLLGFLRIISALILVLVLGTTGYQYIVATPDIRKSIQSIVSARLLKS